MCIVIAKQLLELSQENLGVIKNNLGAITKEHVQ